KPCEDPYTVGFTPLQRLQEAHQRGLNFIALTDHNNVINQTDPAVRAWQAARKRPLIIPAYENSQPGHVQMLGAPGCFGNSGLLEGLREHRTFVSALPPKLNGPMLSFASNSNGDGVYEGQIGSHTRPASAFRVTTFNAAPGSILRIVTDVGETQVALPASGK